MYGAWLPFLLVCISKCDGFFVAVGRQENSECGKDSRSGQPWLCRRLDECETTLTDIVLRGTPPKFCGLNTFHLVVCCRPSAKNNKAPYLPLNRPTQKKKEMPSAASTILEQSYLIKDEKQDDEDAIQFETKRSGKKPTSNIDPKSAMLSKSELKCQEYRMRFCEVDSAVPNRIHIAGGMPARPKEFPHMALVGFGRMPNVMWLCGGSLINERYVLTAAHCATTRYGDNATWVKLGDLDLDSDTDDATPMDYQIVEIKVHPDYRYPSVYHDIALFRLGRRVIFTDYIRPICLNWRRNEEAIYTTAFASGWGQTGSVEPVSPVLREVTLFITPTEQCQQSYGKDQKYRNGIDANSMICAGERRGDKDTCRGDSGGPLQVQIGSCQTPLLQIGITSFGRSCGEPDSPGVYTRISNYIEWIESVVWP